MEGPPAVVVDLGTYVVRVGLAGDDRPLSTFRALVHRDADGSVVLSTDDRVGQCPIDGSGAIVDVDGWLVLVREALRAAHVEDVAASPLLLVDRLSAMEHRPQVAALLFERVGVRKCALACQELAALVASGRLDGLVCHIGHRATTLVPMGRGVADVPAARTVSVGGYHIVASLREALETRRGGVLAASEVDQALARCFVAEQLPKQLHESRGASVDQRALFLAPEILFKPLMARVPWPVVRLLLIGRADATSALYGLPKDLIRLILRHVRFAAVHDLNQRGIVEAMLEATWATKTCGSEPETLLRNVIVSGGPSLLPGLADRLVPHITAWRGRVIVTPERHINSWIGGSILGSLSSISWLEREALQAQGPEALKMFESMGF